MDFVDFLQIQAAFWKTNYTSFSYLLMPIYGQGYEGKWFFACGREISILLDFYRHLLLIVEQLLSLHSADVTEIGFTVTR